MKTFKARALVIKEYETGESDKRLVLLAKGRGKLVVHVRGARKPKSKFMAAAQLFTYADFVIAEGRGFFSITQAEVIESFYGIRTDYDSLCYAHLMVEMCEKTMLETDPMDDLLLLLIKGLWHLSKVGERSPLLIYCAFLFRFYACHGLAPQVNVCVVCGNELRIDSGGFFRTEGILCHEHRPKEGYTAGIYFSSGAIMALRHILNNDVSHAFRFNVSKSVLEELHKGAKQLWMSHFGWKLESERLIQSL